MWLLSLHHLVVVCVAAVLMSHKTVEYPEATGIVKKQGDSNCFKVSNVADVGFKRRKGVQDIAKIPGVSWGAISCKKACGSALCY